MKVLDNYIPVADVLRALMDGRGIPPFAQYHGTVPSRKLARN